MSVKVRFAPAPTGRLHVGNVRTAVNNALFAKANGGRLVLRIDDTDVERSSKEYEAGIEEDLTWLGLLWDEKHRQSERFERYHLAVEKLKADGRLYPAYETQEELDRRRKVQLSRGLPPVYDRAALNLTDAERDALEAEGRKPVWRFRLDGKRVKWTDLVRGEVEVDTASMSDPVLIRADGAYLYTLPSVVDDIEMAITHVLRGEDHVTNTGVQIEVFEALGGSIPQFAHTSLLVGADGDKLSKRLGSLSIADLRAEGYDPQAIVSHLARIGTSDPVDAATMEELAAAFDFDKFGRAPARYDAADLDRINAHILHALDYTAVRPRLQALDADLGEVFWDAVRPNLVKLSDAVLWAGVVQGEVTPVVEDQAFLDTARSLLPQTVDDAAWATWTAAVKDVTGAKGKALFLPLRRALTGQDHGPDMARMLPLIGRQKAEKRLAGQRA
jgi:glutamyl-tRNA synthetase